MKVKFNGVREYIDKNIRKKESLDMTENPQEMLITKNNSFFAEEAYKAARTNIMFSLSEQNTCKVIAVTSPNQHEGKTTTTVNIGISFTQVDAKVLIIDADLRRSNVHRMLEIKRGSGLSDVLCGFIDPMQAIRKNVINGLDILTAGQTPPNPAELLASPTMAEIIGIYKQHYDYIFIDTPPVNTVTEATLISKIVSGMILVVRQNVTTYDALEKAIEALEFVNAKILGCIMNDISTNQSGFTYKYDKKYTYYADKPSVKTNKKAKSDKNLAKSEK